jgi:hypothetical protein
MSLGIECLITDDPGRAMNIAQQLDALNRERREIEAGMQEQALLQLEKAAADWLARTRHSGVACRCSTPTGTRASSASSPRASRKGCTARFSPLPAARWRRNQGLRPFDPRPASARRARPGRPNARPACCCASAATPWPPA